MRIYSHDELSAKAAAWIHARSTRSGLREAFEVAVADGYVVDYAALGWWQTRFCEEHGIYGPVAPMEQRVPGKADCLCEWYPQTASLLFIVESKASRSDFLSTFNATNHHANRRSPIGSLHWVAANHGVCDPAELPGFWGLLEPAGRGMKQVSPPVWHETTEETVNRCAYVILWKTGTGRIGEVIGRLAAAIENGTETK